MKQPHLPGSKGNSLVVVSFLSIFVHREVEIFRDRTNRCIGHCSITNSWLLALVPEIWNPLLGQHMLSGNLGLPVRYPDNLLLSATLKNLSLLQLNYKERIAGRFLLFSEKYSIGHTLRLLRNDYECGSRNAFPTSLWYFQYSSVPLLASAIQKTISKESILRRTTNLL